MARKTIKKLPTSYYQEFKKELNNIVETYSESRNLLWKNSEFAIYDIIEDGITRYPLRYYQMEALYLLDYLYAFSTNELEMEKNTRKKVDKMVLNLLDEIENDAKAPFIGFEMATGSGKTMLMGACIYLLQQKYNVNNFLIITPTAKKDIYTKTIRNFSMGAYDSIWAGDTHFKFNLITGDNYQQNLLVDESLPNIFIFNMDKFGANATNTDKPWESAVWKDDNNNIVSIKEYLKDKKLVIITDEAHHAQNKNNANKIIKKFHPKAVLEFTATAIEQSKDTAKRNQTIVYKYDIRNLLEDGHGKLVRAIALETVTQKIKDKDVIAQSEKLKLITLFLIHLVKKQAVILDEHLRGTKPLSFVKVKQDTNYTQKVYEYIKNELHQDIENIEIIIDKINQQDIEITSLIKNLLGKEFNNEIPLLAQAIKKVADTAIFYHGNSDKETEKSFNEIRHNNVEIVVYMQKLDEGIDLPNIYTMAVINDTETEFKTSVKQIIGRGVRLGKDKREFDNSEDKLLQQAEKLHIVCDKGKNFEEQIQAIQKEFGLNDKYLSYETERKLIINKAKSDLLDGKYLPHIKADLKVKEENGQKVSLMELINNVNSVIDSFIEDNCFTSYEENEEPRHFFRYKPDAFFVEIDIFADEREFHNQILNAGGIPHKLVFNDKDAQAILAIVIKKLYCIPNNRNVENAFSSYLNRLIELDLQYYYISSSDEKLVKNQFILAFAAFYRNYIEKRYFKLDFKPIFAEDSWNLKKQFNDFAINIPIDQFENKEALTIEDKDRLIELIKSGYNFFGYENSIFDYSKFDSYTEKALADYFDKVTSDAKLGLIPFWVRNDRQIYFTYGSKRYYPDFILLYKDVMYVIEGKGGKFFDFKKNQLLDKLNEAKGDDIISKYQGVMVLDNFVDEFDFEKSWNDFVEEAKETARSMTQKVEVEKNINDELKYKSYLPLYTVRSAYRKFYKKHDKVNIEGWVKVSESNYPNSTIALNVMGSALAPKYKNNSIIIMNTQFKKSEINEKIVLVHNKEIQDYYEPEGFTIRKIQLEKIEDDTLFGSNKALLQPLMKGFQTYEINNIISDNDLEVIAIDYSSP